MRILTGAMAEHEGVFLVIGTFEVEGKENASRLFVKEKSFFFRLMYRKGSLAEIIEGLAFPALEVLVLATLAS